MLSRLGYISRFTFSIQELYTNEVILYSFLQDPSAPWGTNLGTYFATSGLCKE